MAIDWNVIRQMLPLINNNKYYAGAGNDSKTPMINNPTKYYMPENEETPPPQRVEPFNPNDVPQNENLQGLKKMFLNQAENQATQQGMPSMPGLPQFPTAVGNSPSDQTFKSFLQGAYLGMLPDYMKYHQNESQGKGSKGSQMSMNDLLNIERAISQDDNARQQLNYNMYNDNIKNTQNQEKMFNDNFEKIIENLDVESQLKARRNPQRFMSEIYPNMERLFKNTGRNPKTKLNQYGY